jgi:trigger factor
VPITQQEQTKPCEVSLEIEVEAEKVKKAFDQAYKEAGKHVNVPGFRKGKAPRAMLERYVSEDHIMEHAAEELVRPAYEEALEEAGIEPYGPAGYEIIHLADAEPFKFRAKVPLAPTVELGKYTGIEVERLSRQVSDEDVEKELESIRQRSAKVENVEGRPAKQGDLAIIRMVEPDGETKETVVEIGNNLASFDKGLIGMNIGETKTIDLVYPKDYEDKELAGTKSQTTVTLNDIKERQLPELNDEFVKQISEKSEEKIETVEQLKDKIKSAMEKAASDIADREIESKIIEKIVESSKIDIPDVMTEHEVAHRLQDLMSNLKNRNLTLEDYFEATGTNFEETQSRMESSAERDIKVSLALGEIAKAEKMEVSDEEVEAEITRMAEESSYPRESIAAYVDKTDGKEAIENRILRRKVLDFLVDNSNIKNVGQKAS